MNFNNYDKKVYDLLKKSLDVSTLRSKAISNNLANINTKNYKRLYVNFKDTLKDAEDSIYMKKTNKKHIPDENEIGNLKLEKDEISSMRQDGNNVNIDNEIVNQAANSLMYDALITEVSNRISMRRSVIKGGR